SSPCVADHRASGPPLRRRRGLGDVARTRRPRTGARNRSLGLAGPRRPGGCGAVPGPAHGRARLAVGQQITVRWNGLSAAAPPASRVRTWTVVAEAGATAAAPESSIVASVADSAHFDRSLLNVTS